MTYFRLWLSVKVMNIGFRIMPEGASKALLLQYLSRFRDEIEAATQESSQ